MKIGVLIIAFNESEYIAQCVRQWIPYVDKVTVLVSTRLWVDRPFEADNTWQLAEQAGAEVIQGYWESETIQRNYGINRLYDYDYVIICDPDEFYTEIDRRFLVEQFLENTKAISFVPENMVTYWKTPNYIFEPGDSHRPFIAVAPKSVQFCDKRSLRPIGGERPQITDPVSIPITLHHMSWVHSDEKVAEKISTYAHFDVIPQDWYENVWLNWKPGSPMLIRPYGIEPSRASYNPAPQEIVDMIDKK